MKEWLESLKSTATPSIDEAVEVLGATFPALLQLSQTEQDTQWHGEGNVHIHTGMVLNELYSILNTTEIDGDRRQALILASILHDVAKVWTTCEREVRDEMHIVAPRHEQKGRSYICFRLMELPLSYDVVQTVMALVGEHNAPKNLVKLGSETGFHRLSRVVDMELLYLLELADMRGRVAEDLAETEELIQLFKMYAHEYGCWNGNPYKRWIEEITTQSGYKGALLDITIAQSLRDKEAERIFTPEEAIARSYNFKEGFSEVIVLCGLSGCGKSSYVSKLPPDYTVISLDRIREELFGKESKQGNPGKVIQAAKEKLREVLRVKGKAVWDATSLRADFRSIVIDLVHDYGGLTTIVFFHTTIDEAVKGNRERTRQVGKDVMNKQVESFEYPTLFEADRFKVVNADGEELWKYGYWGGEITQKTWKD